MCEFNFSIFFNTFSIRFVVCSTVLQGVVHLCETSIRRRTNKNKNDACDRLQYSLPNWHLIKWRRYSNNHHLHLIGLLEDHGISRRNELFAIAYTSISHTDKRSDIKKHNNK